MSMQLANAAIKSGNLSEAVKLLQGMIEADPDHREALAKLGMIHMKILRFADAETAFRAICKLDPSDPASQLLLAQSLQGQSRYADALAAANSALALAPDSPEIKASIAAIEADLETGSSPEPARKLSRWPILMSEIGSYEDAARDMALEGFNAKFEIRKHSRILTLGSCFATNLAAALEKSGFTASHLGFSEEINSTLANRALIDWIAGECSEEIKAHFDRNPGEEARRGLHQFLSESEVVILTVGVAPCFFDKNTGKLILGLGSNSSAWSQNKVLRTTTVEENLDAMEGIFAAIRKINPDINIVLTVSPVPLKATFEKASVIEADCLSKSILRVAVEQALQAHPDITYWPSFEMVRWLAPYFANVYGADDDRSRHVSNQIVSVITNLFMEKHCKV